MAARKPKVSPEPDELVEVTLSVSRDDLAAIDAAAHDAGLSRDAYLAVASKQSVVGLFQAVQHLQAELARFTADGHAWTLEIERLQRQIEGMRRDREQAREVLVAMLATVTEAGAPERVINALNVAIRALQG